MSKPIVSFNNAEHAIINELKRLRDNWYEAEGKLNEDNRIVWSPIVDIYEKQYLQARTFVCKAWNIKPTFIEGVLNGDYEIYESERIGG